MRYDPFPRIGAALLLLSLAVSASGQSGPLSANPRGGNTAMQGGPYRGIKHAVAVRDFENQAGWSGQWRLGNNLSLMLESALFDTGRFVLVEREQLEGVLLEQDLAASRRAAPQQGVAQTGRLRPARYIATGAVVEIEDAQSGADAGVRLNRMRIGVGGRRARITIIAKLIDTTTGEVVASRRIVGTPSGARIRLDYAGTDVGVDLAAFSQSPLGQAAQDCINKAARFFAHTMSVLPLEGSVVTVTEDGEVVVNRGEQFGVQVGQTMEMRVEGAELIDPETGEVLGRQTGRPIGQLRVTRVEERVAYCEVVEGEPRPERGTVVVLSRDRSATRRSR